MTCIMHLLLRILALRIAQHRSVFASSSESHPIRSNVTDSVDTVGMHTWPVQGRDDDYDEAHREENDANRRHCAGGCKLTRRATTTGEEVLFPSRVKKLLIEAHQHQIYSDVDAIAGRPVRLPCFVRPLEPSDSISLVLWFHGEDISGAPIYSVDARFNPFNKAQHFVHKYYQNRQVINFTLNQPDKGSESAPEVQSSPSSSDFNPKPNKEKPISASTAHLFIMPVKERDAGLYWCRVDYRFYRSTISIVTLNVIVPPSQLQIQLRPDTAYCRSDQPCSLSTNQTITVDEDSSVTLVCFSEGGKPLPILNWYRNDELIRSEIFHSLSPNNQTLQSELHLTRIRPTEHNVLLKCLSSNDNQTFLSSQIRLKVNSKPSRVEVIPVNLTKSMAALAGSQITFLCRSYGSRPAANHTWTIVPGQRHLPLMWHTVLLESQLQDENGHSGGGHLQASLSETALSDLPLVTESMVQLTVQPEDNKLFVNCRAENSLLRRGVLEGSMQLNVAFAPKVTLQQLLPSSDKSHQGGFFLSGYSIRGSDLHLLCNISANPTADKVVWYLNSHKISQDELTSNEPITVAENGTRLIVSNVTDDWQGFYQCVVHNRIGSGFSNQFQVQILHKPQCTTPTQTIPANIGSLVTMICDVAANPSNVTFFWHTKHIELSGESDHHLRHHIKNKGLKSRLELRIESGDDFGQYSCWAKNVAGLQAEPCYYNVYENTIKQQLLCESNISSKSIQVQCQPVTSTSVPQLSLATNRSFDVREHGKMAVLYNLKIFKNRQQLLNITSMEPHFLVAVEELRRKEADSRRDQLPISLEMNDSGDDLTTNVSYVESQFYSMLISALANGRLTSDISLSFKVPVESEMNAIVKNKALFDVDFDMDESLQSQNVSLSRYKKIYPHTEPKDTNAASFTTAASIKQLPLIWTVILVTITVLVVLILFVLTKLHSNKRRKKPHVRFSRQHQELPDSNGLSSKEYLMEEEAEAENELSGEKESIQLFTLANFDQPYAYGDRSPGHCGNFSGLQHVNLRSTLPDLMTDTFSYSHAPSTGVQQQHYQMETSQHNLYIIPAANPDGGSSDFTNATNSALQSKAAIQDQRFRTLPTKSARQSMRIALDTADTTSAFCKRTPSVDGIDLVGWLKSEDAAPAFPDRPSCVVRTSSNEHMFQKLQSFTVDINSNQVP